MTEAVYFESSHVSGDFAARRLTVAIARPDAARGLTVRDQVWFSVPADFRTHHDSVAAALMTLVGRTYTIVTFNFPISRHCADWSGRSTKPAKAARLGVPAPPGRDLQGGSVDMHHGRQATWRERSL